MGSERVRDNLPLAGAVMCCTGILPDERAALAQSATELGADHKLDLTSDVTHLVIGGSIDTPKYKYVAKERPDVKVVLPEFVTAVKKSWMMGGGTDVGAIEMAYRAPALKGLIICVTGIENQQREEIITLVKNNGAEYHGDLTKKVTHLIASTASGKKYEHARRWDINTVGPEWLVDSIERGMSLEESLYSPTLAPGDRGQGAWTRVPAETVAAGKRRREEDKAAEITQGKRKLRRTMSAKLGSQHETMWADIAAAGSGKAKREEWQAQREHDSLLGDIGAQNANATPEPTIEAAKRPSAHDASRSSQSGRLFGGALVYIHGFPPTKTAILTTHLESHGAEVCTSPVALLTAEDVENGFMVVPHDIAETEIPAVPALAHRLQRVTEWWVERCLATKLMVHPDQHPLCRPFAKLRIDGFEGITLCSTGFKGIELLHITKVVKLMGARYDEYLKPGVSLLVCNSQSPNKEKLDFAAENGIPAVTEEWLWSCIERGEVQDLNIFEVKMETPTVPVDYRPRSGNSKSFIQGSKKKGSLKAATSLQLEFASPTVTPSEGDTRAAPPRPSRRRGPFIDDDFDDAPQVINEAQQEPSISAEPPELTDLLTQPLKQPAQPLQPQSPNRANSPKKPLHSHNTTRDPSPEKQDTSSSTSGSDTAHLNESIAALLAQKQRSARLQSNPPLETNASRRKRGLLGRATSGSSLTSLSRTPSLAPVQQQPSERVSYADEGEKQPQLPAPSQKIIYEDENLREERLKLIKRLGGNLVEEVEIQRGESIGVVKDRVASDLTTTRARRRR